jgi:hypothetical protein
MLEEVLVQAREHALLSKEHFTVDGWYRHITLAMLAHAVLATLRARGEKNSMQAGAAQHTGTAPHAHSLALARMARR